MRERELEMELEEAEEGLGYELMIGWNECG